MANPILFPMIPGPSYGLSAHPLENVLEVNSATYKKGAILVMSANLLAEGGANPVQIAGVANIPGQNGTSKTGQFHPAIPSFVFEGQIDDATLNNTYALVAGDLMAQYGISKDPTSSLWFVDKSKTGANARVTVVRFKDAVAALNPRVYFIFKVSQTLYN